MIMNIGLDWLLSIEKEEIEMRRISKLCEKLIVFG